MLYSELKKIKDFPCLSCPFLRITQEDKPICSIYSHNSVGLESCLEVVGFLEMNSKKQLEPDSILVFNEETFFRKV
jgi:hypothetical protein